MASVTTARLASALRAPCDSPCSCTMCSALAPPACATAYCTRPSASPAMPLGSGWTLTATASRRAAKARSAPSGVSPPKCSA
eukprot:10851722-Lingulodinium_polyedra.AAC.1